MDGLYRYNRQSGAFARYTENQGLPSSTIRCILEDGVGRLWLSTQKGISRFDPQRETFRNYDVSDGLQSNEFSTGCYQAPNGEMFFGGSNGLNAFFPENVRDNPYVPPVVITSFKIFNKPVPIGAKSVLKKAIPYVDSLTLPYRDNVFSFEFAALSYANSHKNRYRYKLENFEPGWNEVDSKQRLATYTNLDPGKYVFRVQGSNSDGDMERRRGVVDHRHHAPLVEDELVSRSLCAVLVLALLWAVYQMAFAAVAPSVRHDPGCARRRAHTALHVNFMTLCFKASMGCCCGFRSFPQLLPERPVEAKEQLDRTIERAAEAITEGRDAVQGLRESTVRNE